MFTILEEGALAEESHYLPIFLLLVSKMAKSQDAHLLPQFQLVLNKDVHTLSE